MQYKRHLVFPSQDDKGNREGRPQRLSIRSIRVRGFEEWRSGMGRVVVLDRFSESNERV